MKITNFKRTITISNAVFATGNWTLTTTAPHLIGVGEVINLFNGTANMPSAVTTIAGTTGSTIVFVGADATNSNSNAAFVKTFTVSTFPTGFSGFSDVETIGTDNATFQTTTTTTAGTGNHSVQYQVSNDKIAWINKTNSTPAIAASPISDAFSLSECWVYARISVTSVAGTGGKMIATAAGERL